MSFGSGLARPAEHGKERQEEKWHSDSCLVCVGHSHINIPARLLLFLLLLSLFPLIPYN